MAKRGRKPKALRELLDNITKSESFGECASRCFAGGINGKEQR